MDKYEIALDAIREMFSDTTESPEKTLHDLQGLRDEIDIMIDSLKSDWS